MMNPHNIVIGRFVEEIKTAYIRTYGNAYPDLVDVLKWTGILALENIANSDNLYHNVEHTVMVTLVGQEILRGKHLTEGGVTPQDWLHYIMALLCHDIGYVKGICRQDKNGEYATGAGGQTVPISSDGTNASLAPYHVDRGKQFVRERFGGRLIADVDAEIIMTYIEMTRFPVPDDDFYKDVREFPGLTRAADFIGQLGDPNYLRKIPALFYEFEEMGTNAAMGYKSPGDMRKNYAKFYWKVVRPYIQEGLKYLRKTHEGKQWISNLHSHVFTVEHDEELAEL